MSFMSIERRRCCRFTLSCFVDVYFFHNIYKISLTDCQSISDVSCLSNVYDLTLQRCHRVIDIRPLSKIPKVAILNCNGIEDYEPINNCKVISIGIYQTKAIDLTKIQSIYELSGTNRSLVNCKLNYQGIQHLLLYYSTDYEDLEDFHFLLFADVPYVEITFQGGFTDKPSIAGLGRNKEVKIVFNGMDVQDIDCLKNVPKVKSTYSTAIMTLESFTNVKYLEIGDFMSLTSLTDLPESIEYLSLLGINNIDSFEGLERVKVLELDYISYRMDLPDLGPTFDKLVIKFPKYHVPEVTSIWDNSGKIIEAMNDIESDLREIEWVKTCYIFEKTKYRYTLLKRS